MLLLALVAGYLFAVFVLALVADWAERIARFLATLKDSP